MSIRARVTKRIASCVAEKAAHAVHRLSDGPSSPIRQRAARTARWLRRRAFRVQRGSSINVRALAGIDRDGQPREILYLGERQALAWFAQESFGGEWQEDERESVRVRDLSSFVESRRETHDLVVLEADYLVARKFAAVATVRAPRWVRMILSLPPTWDELKATWSRNTRKNVRHTMGGGYSNDLSTSPDDFEAFYEQQYLPLIRMRHANTAAVADRGYLRKVFRRGALLRVFHDGEWVAGQIVYQHGAWARSVSMGLLEGREELLRRGVLKAVYCAGLQWGIENGVRLLDLGRTRPSLNDGVFRYKRGLGAEVREDMTEDTDLLLFRGRSGFCETVEERSPFVIRDDAGKLSARIVLPGTDDLELDSPARTRAERLFTTPGLSALEFVARESPHDDKLSQPTLEATTA